MISREVFNRGIDKLTRKLDCVEAAVREGGTPTTPAYKVYTALLTQTGTDAPTAIILENTLGFTPTWEYFANGYYGFNFPIAPDYNKIAAFYSNSNDISTKYRFTVNGDYNIQFHSATSSDEPSDNLLNNTVFEVRVYN